MGVSVHGVAYSDEFADPYRLIARVHSDSFRGSARNTQYPCLTNGHPETLPGIRELEELAKNAVIVGTEDYCHHGIAYGVAAKDALPMNEEGQAFACKEIESGFTILNTKDYRSYFDHGMNSRAIDDPSDVTAVMHYLVGEAASPKILDLKLVDVSPLFEGDPLPSWVATALVTM